MIIEDWTQVDVDTQKIEPYKPNLKVSKKLVVKNKPKTVVPVYAVFEHATVSRDARLHGVRKNREDALALAVRVVNKYKGMVGYISILTFEAK